MLDFAQSLVGGVALGCVYALAALGFVLIYKATEILNFAQGEFMMVGGFVALAAVTWLGMPYWASLVVAVIALACLGGVINRFMLRPLIGEPVFTIVMATIGLGYLLRSGVTMIPGWGTDTHPLDTPFTGKFIRFGGLAISGDHATAIVVTVVTCIALYFFFRYTRAGIAMQAVSQNQLAAAFVGVRVRSMFSLVWALGAAVAALAGVLLGPFTFVHSNMGLIGLNALPAAVLGGFGSVPGAVVGGLIIGVAEVLGGRYGPEGIKDVVPHIILLGVLLVWPQGLFGVSLKRRV